MLAGFPVAPEDVRQLAEGVDEPAATTLRIGLEKGRAVIALTIEERELILRGLEDCPAGLAELRAVLLEEHTPGVGEKDSSSGLGFTRAGHRGSPRVMKRLLIGFLVAKVASKMLRRARR